MHAGRPPLGSELVQRLEGSEHARRRLKLMLQTLAGHKTVVEASRELGISQQAFFERRAQWLQASLQELEPKAVGRPRREADERDAQIQQMQQRIVELEASVRAAKVREEIAMVMPHVLTRGKAQENGSKTYPRPRPGTPGR